MLLLSEEQNYCDKEHMCQMRSKYFDIAVLLHNAIVVMVAELSSQRTYVSNVKSKCFNKSESLDNALVAMVAELLSQKNMCQM